mmetsp:Transcript_28452/g.41879  ORF Transcript_28452/g.41879 Transcript_28452/m.41879 type:complete len:774 (-) Transcript_28452:67-2388(-)
MRFSTVALLAVVAQTSTHTQVQAFGTTTTKTSTFTTKTKTNANVVAYGNKQTQTQLCMAADPIKITMPALSSTMKEGRIVSWLKAEGEEITAGEAIMVVESDKADMDVEAFEDGYLAKIITGEGESVNVGEVVALIASEESEIAEVANGGGSAAVEEAASTPAEPAAGAAAGYSVPTTEVYMPALSSTMTEGKIVSWLKSEGDQVSAGEAIMVVESDKADMDVEAFEDGYIAKIVTGEGEAADVGALVAIIVENEADIAAVQAAGDVTVVPASTAAVEEAATAGVSAPDCEFSQIDMPALSSTMKEGKIVSWLKAEGDAVSSGEAIMVVESDKADMDVEAFEDGYLAAIVTAEGEVANVGAPVAIIAAEEGDIPALQAYAATLAGGGGAVIPAAAAAPASPKTAAPSAAAPKAVSNANAGGRIVASPLAKKKAEELGVDLSTVVGTGPNGRITGGDVMSASKNPAVTTKAAAAAAPVKPSHIPAAGVIAATPTARVLAKKAKIDLASIVGTGEFGRVTADDVMIATGEKKAPKPARKVAPGVEAVELRDDLEPFTGMQRGVSKNMEATLSVPIFRVSRAIVMNKFEALYQNVKPKGVSVSALLAKAVGLAAEKYPIMNSNYDASGGIKWNADINIAMAVAINGGLITPTIKNANEKNILDIGGEWRELVDKAKAGTLAPDEYQSGTFTISNLGMFGVSQFDAILPPGQGSILAIGGTSDMVVPDKDAVLGLKTQRQMTVTLTCDHRNIYGADAALFLKELADIMENKVETLLL